MGSTANQKKPILIDFFNPNLTPCPDDQRRYLARLLHDASLDQEARERLEDQIQSPGFSEAEGLEMAAYLVQHHKQIDEYYAPTKRMIREHIKKICGLP